MKWEEVDRTRKERIDKAINKLVREVESKQRNSENKVKVGKKFHFFCMRILQLMNWGIPEDKAYWESKGWLGTKRPWKID